MDNPQKLVLNSYHNKIPLKYILEQTETSCFFFWMTLYSTMCCFNLIFVQFNLFPMFDCVIPHSGSQPLNLNAESVKWRDSKKCEIVYQH